MKITKTRLKEIIYEEINKLMEVRPGSAASRASDAFGGLDSAVATKKNAPPVPKAAAAPPAGPPAAVTKPPVTSGVKPPSSVTKPPEKAKHVPGAAGERVTTKDVTKSPVTGKKVKGKVTTRVVGGPLSPEKAKTASDLETMIPPTRRRK